MVTNKQEQNFLKLSIQVSLNGLSFCILNTKSKAVVFYKKQIFTAQLNPAKVLAEIELIYQKESVLEQEVDEVIVIFSNSFYSLVPSPLFSEENVSNYLKFNTKILKTDFIAYDELEKEKIINVYIPYTNIINYFFDKYGEFEYRHSISVLIEELLKLPGNAEPKVYLYNRNKEYDLVIVDNGKLLLCNTFSYETREDFLYYILFTAEQLNLDPLKLDLLLLGNIDRDSALYKMAYHYIRNINFLDIFYSYDLNENLGETKEQSEAYILLKSLS
ncbi:DUF3822 family protein [Salegentibacter sp. F188]|uniref:DUF3822 family protein n=1 Tax=Autumnicola patrickiae TaxID=3075591 RepID=A0ABU3E3U6_9FLAO|nr:DUF3822 family protein [Salegentibacter sp. F188]MDT0690671.1 DUF3822 family protein [Salegentibacter sp. F188]